MARVSKKAKSKTTKAQKEKAASASKKKKIEEAKKVIQEVVEKEPVKKAKKKEEAKETKKELEEVIEKEPIKKTKKKEIVEDKKTKEEKSKEVVVKKPKKKKKKKLITKKTITLFFITLGFIGLLALLIILNNKEDDNVSFVSKKGIKTSSYNETFKAPVYFYTLDKKDKVVELENIKFEDNKMTYRFDEATREEIDDDNILFTIPCDMEVDVEYTETEDTDVEWHYDYSFLKPFVFDYYTGDVYLEKEISDPKYTFTNKEEKKDKKKKTTTVEMEYTNITYISEKVTIGVINNLVSNEKGTAVYQGKNDEGKSYSGTIKARSILYIKAPKDYDGVMIAINKNGMNEKAWKQESEKEKTQVAYRLLDEEDKTRKDYTKDDFYVIRIADMFKDNYATKEEECDIFLFIFGTVALVLAIITSVAFLVKEIK